MWRFLQIESRWIDDYLKNREQDKLDPEIISRMTIDWSYKPIESISNHYQEDYLIPIIDQLFTISLL